MTSTDEQRRRARIAQAYWRLTKTGASEQAILAGLARRTGSTEQEIREMVTEQLEGDLVAMLAGPTTTSRRTPR